MKNTIRNFERPIEIDGKNIFEYREKTEPHPVVLSVVKLKLLIPFAIQLHILISFQPKTKTQRTYASIWTFMTFHLSRKLALIAYMSSRRNSLTHLIINQKLVTHSKSNYRPINGEWPWHLYYQISFLLPWPKNPEFFVSMKVHLSSITQKVWDDNASLIELYTHWMTLFTYNRTPYWYRVAPSLFKQCELSRLNIRIRVRQASDFLRLLYDIANLIRLCSLKKLREMQSTENNSMLKNKYNHG